MGDHDDAHGQHVDRNLNLNNRVGKTRFRHDAVGAVVLQADIAALSEYYPRQHHQPFCTGQSAGIPTGWFPTIMARLANRIIIASRFPIEPPCSALDV